MDNRAVSTLAKLAGLGPVNVTARQKFLALAVGALADAIQGFFWPITVEGAASPVELGIDVAAAALIVLILGWNWRLALAFAIELIPGAALFPTWTATVLMFSVSTETTPKKQLQGAPEALPEPVIEPAIEREDSAKFPGMYTKRTRNP